MNNKILVLSPIGDVVQRRVHDEQAQRWISEGLATREDARSIRLTTLGLPWPCRTRTASGDPLRSACGRSQVMTTADHGHVTGFKSVFVEDLPVFRSAILDNLTFAT